MDRKYCEKRRKCFFTSILLFPGVFKSHHCVVKFKLRDISLIIKTKNRRTRGVTKCDLIPMLAALRETRISYTDRHMDTQMDTMTYRQTDRHADYSMSLETFVLQEYNE